MKNKIIDIKNITSQEKLILAVTFLALIIMATTILNLVLNYGKNIDYRNQTVEELYEEATLVNDREIYWPLNNIISAFINSYQAELTNTANSQNGYSREDFYSVLADSYKKNLSKKKYMEKSKEMCDKFVINNMVVKQDDYIKEIRKLDFEKYSSNMYVVSLKTVLQDSSSYIGIRLMPNTKSYCIFYLE